MQNFHAKKKKKKKKNPPPRSNQGQVMPMLLPLDTLIVNWGLSYCSSTGGFSWDFPRRGHNLATNQPCFLSSMWSPVVYKNKEKVVSHSQAFSGQCLAIQTVSIYLDARPLFLKTGLEWLAHLSNLQYYLAQWRRNRNTIRRGGGAGVRGGEVAGYLCEASACEGQKLGGIKSPPRPPPPPSSAALDLAHLQYGKL